MTDKKPKGMREIRENLMSGKLSRRELLKLGASAGAIAAFVGGDLVTGALRAQTADAKLPQVPRRVLGKTGKEIPILLMGAAVKLDPKFDPKLAEGLRFGVNYIDAADCYGGGSCEAAVGNFLAKATTRKKVWITSKSDAHDPKGFEETCSTGLQRMQTDYFDMYFLHALKDANFLNNALQKTVEKLQKEGKILHFGFSCHNGNVVELLNKAAETPWVDSVMFRYNFAQYDNKELNKAMDACVKTGVGLIAMKTQGSGVSFEKKWQAIQKIGKWTKHQAVLKAVWADERITAAVSHMDNFEKLKQNIGAAVDDDRLGQAEFEALNRYADSTRSETCDGCDHLCGAEVAAPVQIGDTMRFLMYHDTYGEPTKAKELFSKLPASAKQLSDVDFTAAEEACPFGFQLVRHMQRAAEVFSA